MSNSFAEFNVEKSVHRLRDGSRQSDGKRNGTWLPLWVLCIFLLNGGHLFAMDNAPATSEMAHEFSYKPDAARTPKTVNLAGEFNNWSTITTSMVKGDDGTYRVTVKLHPGKHFYKLVLDGSIWLNDPTADKALEEDDGQQGKNSAVIVSAKDSPQAQKGSTTFAYHPDGATAPKSVNLAGEFNNWSTNATPMTADASGTFTVKIKLKPGIYHYKFVIDGAVWTPDPKAEKSLEQEDGHGGVNSGVTVK